MTSGTVRILGGVAGAAFMVVDLCATGGFVTLATVAVCGSGAAVVTVPIAAVAVIGGAAAGAAAPDKVVSEPRCSDIKLWNDSSLTSFLLPDAPTGFFVLRWPWCLIV